MAFTYQVISFIICKSSLTSTFDKGDYVLDSIDNLFDWFWGEVLHALMKISGMSNFNLARIALFAAYFLHLAAGDFLASTIVMITSIFLYLPHMKAMEDAFNKGADIVGVPLQIARVIIFIRVIACARFILVSALLPFAAPISWPLVFNAAGSGCYAAGGYFMFHFHPKRKSPLKKAIDWLKNRNWHLGGGHMPAPTPI